jgi:hypothetical protein
MPLGVMAVGIGSRAHMEKDSVTKVRKRAVVKPFKTLLEEAKRAREWFSFKLSLRVDLVSHRARQGLPRVATQRS